jgi:hypothetical protein
MYTEVVEQLPFLLAAGDFERQRVKGDCFEWSFWCLSFLGGVTFVTCEYVAVAFAAGLSALQVAWLGFVAFYSSDSVSLSIHIH